MADLNSPERERMDFDVIIVGAGPSGLATACKLAQLAQAAGQELNIAVLEKGAEVGSHIVSGALLETAALGELFPDWATLGAPVKTRVSSEDVLYLRSNSSYRIPDLLVPGDLHNVDRSYVISLGLLCRWMAEQAEALGVNILTGFAASALLYNDKDQVTGVQTGDLGINRQGEQGPNYTPGYELYAPYTVLAEGCRGHLGKEVISRFKLDNDRGPQHYALGIKEIWEIPREQARPGHVVHTLGWPLSQHGASGGGFLYHQDHNQVAVGLITDLNYENPWLSPFEEFQRYKHHPVIAKVLANGKRLNYGARALVKGGLQALPRLVFPGGLLVGDNAGFLNFLKLKGTHTAIRSGMLAAQALFDALGQPDRKPVLKKYQQAFAKSGLHEELHKVRNCGPAVHRFGTMMGAGFSWLDQSIFKGRLPFTLQDPIPDHASLRQVDHVEKISYAKPDNILGFDRPGSVYLSGTFHEEDQPVHLLLQNPATPVEFNLPQYEEPAQRYCPAGVYEIVRGEDEAPRFQINAQNCVHCKTCDIKDPTQNIRWVAPEGGGGPNYPDM